MSYVPEFSGSIEGYVRNHAKRNLWRIRATHDEEDVVQEAYITFLTVASYYPMIDTPQHFMALFKTSWENEFNNLSTKARSANICTSEVLEVDDGQVVFDTIGELDNQGPLKVMIKQAPSEVQMVLSLFLSAPQELFDLATKAWRSQGKYRADGNKAIARMLGLPPDAEPLEKTREYFTTQN